jgi:NAD(P)-dependent dehydrogenase (short-subunit alcohol dehydrogenase family)
MSSEKKTVVITGVTRGIGRGLLEQLAKKDEFDKVIGICRDGTPLNELKTQFKTQSSKVHLFGADVTNLNSMNQVASQLKTLKIVPDTVIANAGVFTRAKPVWEISELEFEDNCNTNVKGVFNTMKSFLPLMKDKKNAVFMSISSDWGTCGNKGFGANCMSKFAVEGLTQAAGQDTKNDQVTVVSINPGLVYSNMLVEAFGEAEAKKIGAPMDKFLTHFVTKMSGITRQANGQHLDFSLEGTTGGGRIAGK